MPRGEIIFAEMRGDECLLSHPVFHNGFQDKIFQFCVQFESVITEGASGKDFDIRLQQVFLTAWTDKPAFISVPGGIIECLEIVSFFCIDQIFHSVYNIARGVEISSDPVMENNIFR